jgi:hypothetical protein
MTIKSKLMTRFAASILVSALAAHAQNAMAPDPNLAPSTAGEEARLPPSAANSPEIAADPDPNVAPSTAGEEANLPCTDPNSPELAADSDPNLAPSTTTEEPQDESSALGAGTSIACATPDASQQ